MITVVVIDDEALVRSGFQLILDATDDIRVIGTATGMDALDVVERANPDVVLLDIRMPKVDGLQILAALRRRSPSPVVAMLTTFDTDEYIVRALAGGAAGYLFKDTEPDELAHHVRSLAAGAVVLAPRASRALLHSHPALASAVDHEAARALSLTARERQVLILVAEGLSNAEIGQRMHLAAGTIKDHVSAILVKLGVTGRVQAALAAQRAGLLTTGQR